MGSRLTGAQLAFYKAVDKILWNDWDPIGVSDFGPEDEYRSYLPHAFSLALADKEEDLGRYLFEIETGRMGLAGKPENCRRIAALIMAEKKKLSI